MHKNLYCDPGKSSLGFQGSVSGYHKTTLALCWASTCLFFVRSVLSRNSNASFFVEDLPPKRYSARVFSTQKIKSRKRMNANFDCMLKLFLLDYTNIRPFAEV